MSEPRVGVYPGTFDPIHNGHVDIIRRAAALVDRLIVAVAINAGKDPCFDLEHRTMMVEHEIAGISATLPPGHVVEVRSFKNLLMQFAAEVRATMVIRGLRAVSDFEYEFQMAANNKRLHPEIETAFLMASEHHQFLGSRFVKEINALGGDVSSMVSPFVLAELDRRQR
ncbi:Phosphopantetheine adenylyltransferase [Arboricoccus pini]|uniref:Phosphopantetheine adenylyltransferase n=1 Tax=Arboricoccus pini TaxID=1963835 RepID=A0A212R6A3_9PROT|nr:pantetheine-phosphate adenylyltransferase [Arboricoccus pini]SNB67671.1 Phosphopantetheine adenylyltransferase [Arboricoccus pini]